MRERWLGIDPGLARIGWAILDQDEEACHLVDCGIIETSKKSSTSERLLEIESDIYELAHEFSPNNIMSD